MHVGNIVTPTLTSDDGQISFSCSFCLYFYQLEDSNDQISVVLQSEYQVPLWTSKCVFFSLCIYPICVWKYVYIRIFCRSVFINLSALYWFIIFPLILFIFYFLNRMARWPYKRYSFERSSLSRLTRLVFLAWYSK